MIVTATIVATALILGIAKETDSIVNKSQKIEKMKSRTEVYKTINNNKISKK